MFNKKSMSSLIAVSLLIVVGVVSVIGFQTWFQNFSTITFTNVELKSNSEERLVVENILGNKIYIKNPNNSTIQLNKLKIGSIDCDINQNLSYGVTGIGISECLAQQNSKSQEVVLYTSDSVVSKKVFISDLSSNIPYLSLSSNSTLIPYNSSISLSWESNSLVNCLASGNWSGIKNVSDSELIPNLLDNSSFTLDCTTSNQGNKTETINVTVTELPIITFNANSSTLAYNSSTNLTWNVLSADTCSASGNWSGSKSLSGTYNTGNLNTSGNSSYILTCSGFGGTSTSTVTISVESAFDPTYNPCPGFNISSELKCVYNYTGSWENFTIGGGISNITVKAWGSSGPQFYSLGGGGGAYIEWSTEVVDNDTIQVSPGYASDTATEMSVLKLNGVDVLIAGGGGKSGGYWNGGGWIAFPRAGAGGIEQGESAEEMGIATSGKPGNQTSDGANGCCTNYNDGGSYWKNDEQAGGYFNSGRVAHGRDYSGDAFPFISATGGGSSLVPVGGSGLAGSRYEAGNRDDSDRGSAAESGNSGRFVIYYS